MTEQKTDEKVSQVPLMYRVMGKDENDKPIIHDDLGLGARERKLSKKGNWTYGDIKVKDGKVILDNDGMSVYSAWTEIYPGWLPIRNGGQNENDVYMFKMGEGPFVSGISITPHLNFFFPGYDYHGTLTPVRMVSLAEYRQHLADTKESWVLNFEEDRNAN